MVSLAHEEAVGVFSFRKEIEIAASIEISFQAVLDEMGPDNRMPDGTSLQLKLEAWPGGRWFRDLGNNAGHLWGHVQVIKPPALLEIWGPMPMPYPAVNHIQYRLKAEGKLTRLTVSHRAMGLIPQEHRDGMPEGWETWVKRIRETAEKRAKRG